MYRLTIRESLLFSARMPAVKRSQSTSPECPTVRPIPAGYHSQFLEWWPNCLGLGRSHIDAASDFALVATTKLGRQQFRRQFRGNQVVVQRTKRHLHALLQWLGSTSQWSRMSLTSAFVLQSWDSNDLITRCMGYPPSHSQSTNRQ